MMLSMSRSKLAKFLLTSVLGLSLALSGDASAAKKKKPAKKPAKTAKVAPAPKADPKAVADLMGKFKWGMTVDEVKAELAKQIEAKYTERIKATTNIGTQDDLRREQRKEIADLGKKYEKFEGKKTGWDVSPIDKEFAHGNDESMLYVWELDPATKKDNKRFFFFVEGKLWKMFISINTEAFAGKTFADFQAAMEARYGKASDQVKNGYHFLAWKSPGHYLRAIDLTEFYGTFVIAISDESVESWINDRRLERNPKGEKTNILDSVTEGKKDDSKPSLDDPNSDVVDRITR